MEGKYELWAVWFSIKFVQWVFCFLSVNKLEIYNHIKLLQVKTLEFSKRTLAVLGRSHDTFTDVTKLVESFGLVDSVL